MPEDNGENGEGIATDDKSWWQNPLVMSFGIVGILFVLTVILGMVNVYIWYVEKQKKRGFGDMNGGIKKQSQAVSPRTSHNMSRTHLQINMSRGNMNSGGSARPGLGKQSSAAGRK